MFKASFDVSVVSSRNARTFGSVFGNSLFEKQSIKYEFSLIDGNFRRLRPVIFFCVFGILAGLSITLRNVGSFFIAIIHKCSKNTFVNFIRYTGVQSIFSFNAGHFRRVAVSLIIAYQSLQLCFVAITTSFWMLDQESVWTSSPREDSICSLDWELWEDCTLSCQLSISSLSPTFPWTCWKK